jgi:hypothetical protein
MIIKLNLSRTCSFNIISETRTYEEFLNFSIDSFRPVNAIDSCGLRSDKLFAEIRKTEKKFSFRIFKMLEK